MLRKTVAILILLISAVVLAGVAVASNGVPSVLAQLPSLQCCGTTAFIVGSVGVVFLLYLYKKRKQG